MGSGQFGWAMSGAWTKSPNSRSGNPDQRAASQPAMALGTSRWARLET